MTIKKIILTAILVLIPAGVYSYQSGAVSDTVLRIGLKTGNQKLVTESIKRGARLYQSNSRASTSYGGAVSQAAYQGEVYQMKQMIQGGAQVNRPDDAGLTPLHCAAVRGHDAMVMFLLDNGVDINAKVSKNVKKAPDAFFGEQPAPGTTPLMLAAVSNSNSCVQILLEHGSDVTLKNSHGETALQMVQRSSSQRRVPSFHVAKVIALLKYGPAALKSSS